MHPLFCTCQHCAVFELQHGKSCECATCWLEAARQEADQQLDNLNKYGTPFSPVPNQTRGNVIDFEAFKRRKRKC